MEVTEAIQYIPWVVRGYSKYPCWQVYVNTKTKSLSNLREIKRELSAPPVRGVLIIENKSKAIKRLGWEEMADGIYYKIFP